eukprot:3705073-Prymnesium_polylepis.1
MERDTDRPRVTSSTAAPHPRTWSPRRSRAPGTTRCPRRTPSAEHARAHASGHGGSVGRQPTAHGASARLRGVACSARIACGAQSSRPSRSHSSAAPGTTAPP